MAFTSGTTVHIIDSWNNAAQISVKRGVVQICDDTKMTIVDEAGIEFRGYDFVPKQQQKGYCRVFANLDDGLAECLAEAMCEEIRLSRLDEYDRMAESLKAQGINKGENDPEGFYAMITEDVALIKADTAQVHWL